MEDDGEVLLYTMIVPSLIVSLIIGIVYWPQLVQVVQTWIH